MQQDDTERLQAMLDRGEPIIGGVYRISRPLILGDGAEMRGCTIRYPREGDALDVRGPVSLSGNTLEPG